MKKILKLFYSVIYETYSYTERKIQSHAIRIKFQIQKNMVLYIHTLNSTRTDALIKKYTTTRKKNICIKRIRRLESILKSKFSCKTFLED